MPIDGLLTTAELAEELGHAASKIRAWAARHKDFPEPVRIGNTNLWDLGEVEQWLEENPRPS